MIEINLSPSNNIKKNELERILSLINFRLLVIALLLLFIPEWFYTMIRQEDIDLKKEEEVALNEDIRRLSQEIRSLKKIEDEVAALKKLEDKLVGRIQKVRTLFDNKKNPYQILRYLAENIPSDVWIVELSIENDQLYLLGFSQTWKSMGDFINNLKNSVFINKNIHFEQPKSLLGQYKEWERMEIFSLKTSIIRYE